MKFRSKPQPGCTLISLPDSANAPWRWRWQPAQGEPQEGEWLSTDGAHNLPDAALSPITLLLPAERFLFRPVTFSGKLKRGSQALLWPLEAFALGDVEQLHITVLAREDDNYHLAAIEKTQLSHWLAELQQQGLTATRALPDVLALPAYSAVRLDQHWLVRSGSCSGLSATDDELALLSPASGIICHSPCPADRPGWQQGEEQAALALLMQGARQPPVNLLHGEYAPCRPRSWQPGWRLPQVLAACWLLSFAAAPLLAGWQAQQQTRQLQQQAATLYQQAFPAAPATTQPRKQLVQQLLALESAQKEPGLLALLAAAQPLLNALPAGDLQSISWRDKALTLELRTGEQSLQPLLAKHQPARLNIHTTPRPDNGTQLQLTRSQP